jgi:cytochrome c oxidase subunit II
VTSTGQLILILYSALSIIGVAIGLFVFRSTRVGFHVRVAGRETIEQREGYWGIAVIAFLVVALGGTIFSIPYWSDTSTARTPQRIEVTGRQFAWTISPPRVRAGLKTRIEVRSADVNHAFGLYDPSETLVKQVNVLPGLTQDVVFTFNKPGTWTVRCLEFCGVDHHLMQNVLRVTR